MEGQAERTHVKWKLNGVGASYQPTCSSSAVEPSTIPYRTYSRRILSLPIHSGIQSGGRGALEGNFAIVEQFRDSLRDPLYAASFFEGGNLVDRAATARLHNVRVMCSSFDAYIPIGNRTLRDEIRTAYHTVASTAQDELGSRLGI